MRILVTGREGQVVQSLVEAARFRPDIELISAGRPGLDLEEPASVMSFIQAAEPDLVVSAAAYTAVDQAEDEPEKAFAINATGAQAVAQAAAAAGVPIVHLSTDYVFSGASDTPYGENDATGPQGVYGRSKLEGERLVAAVNARHLILRTAWVYSPFGKNFLKTMLRLAETRDEISVVSDQWGNPTSAPDIAAAIIRVADVLCNASNFNQYGIYHLTGTGDTNWSGFARCIQDCARELGGPSARIRDIATAEFPTKALRPANSRLSSERFATVFGWRAPHWKDASRKIVQRLLSPEV